jgi:hypothetical protein
MHTIIVYLLLLRFGTFDYHLLIGVLNAIYVKKFSQYITKG